MKTEAEWRERASQDVSDALRGVQAALHRENCAHVVELFTFKQQVTGTPKVQKELSKLQHENSRLHNERIAKETHLRGSDLIHPEDNPFPFLPDHPHSRAARAEVSRAC